MHIQYKQQWVYTNYSNHSIGSESCKPFIDWEAITQKNTYPGNPKAGKLNSPVINRKSGYISEGRKEGLVTGKGVREASLIIEMVFLW